MLRFISSRKKRESQRSTSTFILELGMVLGMSSSVSSHHFGVLVCLCSAVMMTTSSAASSAAASSSQVFLYDTELPTTATVVVPPTPTSSQNTSTPEAIVRQAYTFLDEHLIQGNRCWTGPNGEPNQCYNFHFFRPSLTKYATAQWLWDSGSHMITWSHRNVSNSILDLRTMLQMQRENGFLGNDFLASSEQRDGHQQYVVLQ
jgi:hypothetical protein